MKVALVQMTVLSGEVAENRRRVVELALEAAKKAKNSCECRGLLYG